MRKVRLTFITTIPDAETDDQAYLIADAEVSYLDAPGDWVFDGMEVYKPPTYRDPAPRQAQITDYDPDTDQPVLHP